MHLSAVSDTILGKSALKAILGREQPWFPFHADSIEQEEFEEEVEDPHILLHEDQHAEDSIFTFTDGEFNINNSLGSPTRIATPSSHLTSWPLDARLKLTRSLPSLLHLLICHLAHKE